MALLDDKVRVQLQGILGSMQDRVNLAYFTQEFECRTCGDARTFIEEISALSPKINFEVFDFVKDKEKVDAYSVDKIPAIIVLDKDKNDTGIKFYGLPGGYEINSFLGTILETSGKKEAFSSDIVSRLEKITKEVHIEVFVALSCPACPAAVTVAHRMALENRHIKADMIDSMIFPHLAVRHSVSSVPHILFNGKEKAIGAQPPSVFLDIMEKL
jgi:glutaredoxin-like protein